MNDFITKELCDKTSISGGGKVVTNLEAEI